MSRLHKSERRQGLPRLSDRRDFLARIRVARALYEEGGERVDPALLERFLWWEGLDEAVGPRHATLHAASTAA